MVEYLYSMLPTKTLKNRYFIMRHGHSQANEAGIVVSDPKNGVDGYGLSELGKMQARTSIEEAKNRFPLDEDLVIISSDFKRCRETAEIVSEYLGTSNVELEPRLRERFFGSHELGPNTAYEQVWEQDVINDQVGSFGAESCQQVLERGVSVIQDLEERFADEAILLVSHGDTLQILLTLFHNIAPGRHRELVSLATAEIRALSQS